MEKPMAGGPSDPQTHFQAWGEGVYAMALSDPKVVNPMTGLVVLFQITDPNRWASWYYFTTDQVIDIELMGSTHKVLGEASKRGSHFATQKPITVGGLLGSDKFRRAVLLKGHSADDGVIHLSVVINNTPGMTSQIATSAVTKHPIQLYIKARGDESALDDFRPTFGWINATGIEEKFNFNFPYANKHAKLRSFERTLSSGATWVMMQ
jgi:hypothetical protein